jgi:hypothetical protein
MTYKYMSILTFEQRPCQGYWWPDLWAIQPFWVIPSFDITFYPL